MTVLGTFMGEYNSGNFAVGGCAAFEADWVHVETYTGASVEEDRRCFLKLGAGYLVTAIKRSDGSYLDPETANALVTEIALKKAVDLDLYQMGFFGVWDTRPDSVCIRNELDEDLNPVPLEVVSV